MKSLIIEFKKFFQLILNNNLILLNDEILWQTIFYQLSQE